MGQCMSVCDKLFPRGKSQNKDKRSQQQQDSSYLDGNFNKLKKPLLSSDYQQRGGEEGGGEKRKRIGESGQDDQQENNKRKESISIEMQERRVMEEKLREMEEIEKEEVEEEKRKSKLNKNQTQSKNVYSGINFTQPKQNTSIANGKSNTKYDQQNGDKSKEPIQSQSQAQQMDVQNLLKPKKVESQQKQATFGQLDNKSNANDINSNNKISLKQQNLQQQALSSISTQEQGEKEEDDHNQEAKRSVKEVNQMERESQRKQENYKQELVNNDGRKPQYPQNVENNEKRILQSKKGQNEFNREIDDYVEDEEFTSEIQLEIEEFGCEKWKHIDSSKQTYLQNRKSSETYQKKNKYATVPNDLDLKDEEEDEETNKQKEEKLKEIRKSLQMMNLTKNSTFQHQGGHYHYQPQHTHHFPQSQQIHGHPGSVPSFIQEGFSKISSIPIAQAQSVSQNLNQFCADETDLSLLLSDSQKNSIFFSNFQCINKDSKFFLDESIIHPVKPQASGQGGILQHGEGADSDSSSKREDELIDQLRKQQSTHDLINLLQQATSTYPQQQPPQNVNTNNNNHFQSSDQLGKKSSIKSEGGKFFKSKEDLFESEKDKQQYDSFEHFKNTVINQIHQQKNQQGQVSSSTSIGNQITKKEYDDIIQSRKGSQNNINKQNNKNQSIEKNKSLPISDDNLVPIKEEESKIVGESSITQQLSNKGEQHDFSFCVDSQNQNKQEDPQSNLQMSTAVMLQKSEVSLKANEDTSSNANEKQQQQQTNNEINTNNDNNNNNENNNQNISINSSPNKVDSIANNRKHSQSQTDIQKEILQNIQENSNSYASRFSLRQPAQKHIYNRSDSGNIQIVVQDPRNVTTEQLVFTIHPFNSKLQLNQNASSQRDSIISQNNGEKRDSVLNKTMPHRSLLENTNRVIMQKRPSKKNLALSQSSSGTAHHHSIFQTEKNQENNMKQSIEQQQQSEKLEREEDQNVESYQGIHQFPSRNAQQTSSSYKMADVPINEHEDEEEEKNENNENQQENRISSLEGRKYPPPIQTNSVLMKSQSILEQNSILFEEELKQMKLQQQDQINEEEEKQSASESNTNTQIPQLQMTTSNSHDFNIIGNGVTHSESYKNFPTSINQGNEDEGNTPPSSSPNMKPSSHESSKRTSYRFYSFQSIAQGGLTNQNSQKNINNNNQNSNSIDSPFYTAFNTPLTSKRESQNLEPKVLSQQEFQQRKSMINESKQISYYRKNSAMQYYDCDSYQLQVINGDQLQNKDLLEQPELYMQWLDTLNKNTSETFSSEAIYQFEIIKQETYQDFLYKFEQEYHFNLELFDPIIESKSQNIYFRSELGLDQERLYIITGEYYVNTSSYAAFYNFKNSASIQTILNSYDYIYSLNDDLQNTVLYANCTARQLSKPCEFVFLKHFSFLQYNNEIYDQQGEFIQPVEQMCEIDISLNSEEIEQFVKKNKKNNCRGEVFSGNIATFIPETNQIKVEIMMEYNFHNNLTPQQAKSMYTEMFTNYFKKLNYVFP